MTVSEQERNQGSSPPPQRRTFVLRVLASLVGLFLLIAGIGLLITKVLDKTSPFDDEVGVNEALADDRTSAGDSITKLLSELASTPVIIGILLIMVVVFRLVYKRWRESVFIFFAVWTQSLVFLAVQAVAKRDRPPKELQLDSAPPTSSFPSGHTGAAVALFVSIALILAWHTRSAWLRPLLIAMAIGLPLAVAYSRLYRGMHFPSDVAASFINGLLAVTIWARSVLFGALPERWARALDGSRHSSASVAQGGRTGAHA